MQLYKPPVKAVAVVNIQSNEPEDKAIDMIYIVEGSLDELSSKL